MPPSGTSATGWSGNAGELTLRACAALLTRSAARMIFGIVRIVAAFSIHPRCDDVVRRIDSGPE